MTTWTGFLSDIRNDLQDTSSNPRWTDDMLYLFTKDGIRDYSTWFPLRKDHVVLVYATGKYTLPTDFVDDIFVECPSNTFLEKRYVRPGATYEVSSSAPKYYFIQGGGVYLDAVTTETVYMTYMASHLIPTSKTDSTTVFTVPDNDLELIRLFVKAKVYGQMRSRQSALDRFKVGNNKRDDNPLEPEVENTMADYLRGIAQRIPGGLIMLHKIGRGQ